MAAVLLEEDDYTLVAIDFPDAFDEMYKLALKEGLGPFVMFWSRKGRRLDIFSISDFEFAKCRLASVDIVVEGTIVSMYKGGFVEYVLFNRYQPEPNDFALLLTQTEIYRSDFYAVCYPKDSLRTIHQSVIRRLEMKFKKHEKDSPHCAERHLKPDRKSREADQPAKKHPVRNSQPTQPTQPSHHDQPDLSGALAAYFMAAKAMLLKKK